MAKANITGLDKEGTYRSLSGAASENIFIGRASAAGFFCFFKVWRDMPYDAILDYKGILYRVEVKGSAGNNFDISRGGRSGQQIDRTADNRKRPIDRNDCDFVVCVDTNTNDCYIVPVDFIEIVGGTNFSKTCLAQFKEKWELFMLTDGSLNKAQAQDGLKKLTITEIQTLATNLSVTVPGDAMKISGKQITKTGEDGRKTKKPVYITEEKDKTIIAIWKHFCEQFDS